MRFQRELHFCLWALKMSFKPNNKSLYSHKSALMTTQSRNGSICILSLKLVYNNNFIFCWAWFADFGQTTVYDSRFITHNNFSGSEDDTLGICSQRASDEGMFHLSFVYTPLWAPFCIRSSMTVCSWVPLRWDAHIRTCTPMVASSDYFCSVKSKVSFSFVVWS